MTGRQLAAIITRTIFAFGLAFSGAAPGYAAMPAPRPALSEAAFSSLLLKVQSVDPGDPDGGQTLLGAGLATRWGPAEISVGYRGRMGEAYDSHQGGVEVTFAF